MTAHLWPLLRLQAPSETELVEAYRQVFLKTYIKTLDGREVILKDWNGTRVQFHPKVISDN